MKKPLSQKPYDEEAHKKEYDTVFIEKHMMKNHMTARGGKQRLSWRPLGELLRSWQMARVIVSTLQLTTVQKIVPLFIVQSNNVQKLMTYTIHICLKLEQSFN